MRAQSLMKITSFSAVVVLTAGILLSCKGSSLAVRDATADLQPATGGVASLGGNQGNGGVTGAGGTGMASTGGSSGVTGAGGSGGVRSTSGNGGALASGGTSGNACLVNGGAVSATVKACASPGDCTIATIRTCCGSDLAVGLAKTASCTFPVPDCTGLGCAKMLYPRTDDGDTADADSIVSVRCLANLCTTYVSRPPGGGGTGGPSGTGGTNGSGGASGEDAAAGDAGTGACTTDGDCVFRANAGCCGQCLAVSDPVPPTIPCGARCADYTPCACVNGHCSVGTLPLNSSCDTTHDLCQVNTKCCVACGPRLADGGIACMPPACTTVVSSSAGVGCPLTM
jgi:hypothetical protein